MKVAIIGAGSIGFTRGIVKDILCVPEFRDDTQFAFHDISAQNLNMVYRLCKRDMEANKVKSTISATLNRRQALKGANYIFCVVRVGGLEGFQTDIDIPLKYGVDQCVGDTLCAGGIMYAQRTIPAMLDFCRDASEVAAPGCVFISHVNPMVMNTWACTRYGHGVKTVGLCHGVEGGHWQITEIIKFLINGKGRRQPGSPGYVDVKREEVDIVCAGINHQTWYIQARYKGEDWCSRLLEGFEAHPAMSQSEKVRIDMLRRFGYYSTESNGHLSEYVPWYRKRTNEIRKWIDLGCWINGETGGYLRVCTEGRNWFKTDFPNWMKGEPLSYGPARRGSEHGSYILESLETRRVYRGHFNVLNEGCITNLPADCIVEVPGYVDGNGLNIPRVGDLPLGCAAVLNHSISVQRLAVEAAVHGDDQLLRQAMMMDPLVGAVCDPPEIWQMVDEMLVAQAKWLPQYGRSIAAARRRLARGALIKTRTTRGAARIRVKTVAEMARDSQKARESSSSADKAAADRARAMRKVKKRGIGSGL
jgi:alpha-galactosidase